LGSRDWLQGKEVRKVATKKPAAKKAVTKTKTSKPAKTKKK
jgi:hypothetical protein